jgi:hypothetical protein
MGWRRRRRNSASEGSLGISKGWDAAVVSTSIPCVARHLYPIGTFIPRAYTCRCGRRGYRRRRLQCQPIQGCPKDQRSVLALFRSFGVGMLSKTNKVPPAYLARGFYSWATSCGDALEDCGLMWRRFYPRPTSCGDALEDCVCSLGPASFGTALEHLGRRGLGRGLALVAIPFAL